MNTSTRILLSAGLVLVSGLFILLEGRTGWEFFWHLAAIPLEILFAVLLVEALLEAREVRSRRHQMMLIKSYVFRSELRDLFIANFAALKTPALTLEDIQKASLAQLREFRRRVERIEYQSLDAMEPVVDAYVAAEPVWHAFRERAIAYNFEDTFLDMMAILHFVCDVKNYRARHPGRAFLPEAARRERTMQTAWAVLSDGIRRFLDFAIELKDQKPAIFEKMMRDYRLAARQREQE